MINAIARPRRRCRPEFINMPNNEEATNKIKQTRGNDAEINGRNRFFFVLIFVFSFKN
jgi:hypothetical protein